MNYTVVRVDKWGDIDVSVKDAEIDDILKYFDDRYEISKKELEYLKLDVDKMKLGGIFPFRQELIVKTKEKEKKNVFLF